MDGNELKRKRGAATVLALLVSFLFGYAPAAAQGGFDRSAQLGPTELVKRGPALRTSVRSQVDDSDPDSVLLPPPPAVLTDLVATQPGADFNFPAVASDPRRPAFAYRARAPPAA